MLTPEKIKPYIAHNDDVVSRAAIAYFAKSILYENDSTLMPLVLKKVQQDSEDEPLFLHLAYRFRQSAESIQQIMELVSSPRIGINTKFHLTQMLLYSDLSLLEPYMKELEQQQPFMSSLQKRKDILNMTDDQLFQAFEQYLKDSNGKYYNELDTFYGNTLVEELGRRSCAEEDHILRVLKSFNPDADYGYEIIYYSQLAGEKRMETAIPFLMRFPRRRRRPSPRQGGRCVGTYRYRCRRDCGN